MRYSRIYLRILGFFIFIIITRTRIVKITNIYTQVNEMIQI